MIKDRKTVRVEDRKRMEKEGGKGLKPGTFG